MAHDIVIRGGTIADGTGRSRGDGAATPMLSGASGAAAA
jgi:hypothetical protein